MVIGQIGDQDALAGAKDNGRVPAHGARWAGWITECHDEVIQFGGMSENQLDMRQHAIGAPDDHRLRELRRRRPHADRSESAFIRGHRPY